MRDLRWPAQQLTLELLFSLRAHNWVLPAHLSEILAKGSMGWQSTLSIENAFRICRRREVGPSGKSGLLGAWHSLCSSPDFLPEWGRRHLHAEPSLEGASTLRDTFCELDGGTAWREEDLDLIMHSSPCFPTLGVTASRESVLRSLAVADCGGDWNKLSESWLSQLAMPGWLLHHTSRLTTGWPTLRATNFGIIALRCQLKKRRNVTVITELFKNVHDLVYLRIDSLQDWKVLPVDCLAPCDKRWVPEAGGSGLLLLPRPGAKGKPLLHMALLHGCRSLTLAQLRRLTARECSTPGLGSSSSSNAAPAD